MFARTALPVLLLSLLALPAHADLAFPSNDCKGKKEGDPCQDFYSGSMPGQCRHMRCPYGNPYSEEESEDNYYDCFQCATPEQLAFNQRAAMRARQATRAERIRWGLGALGAGCVITAVWYGRQRRSETKGTGPASK